MSTSNDAKSRNVLETQRPQRPEESTVKNENELETTQKDKHKKRHEKKKNSHSTSASASSAAATSSNSNSSSSNSSSSSSTTTTTTTNNIALARQFSVQRTDSDGCLRMKISAIRPTVTTTNVIPPPTTSPSASTGTSKSLNCTSKSIETTETIKLKISPPPPPPKRSKTAVDKAKSSSSPPTSLANMSVIINPCKDKIELPLTLIPLSLATTASTTTAAMERRLESDVTDSGCSEATNTTSATVAVQLEKLSKRKIKRKKSLIKGNESSKRSLKTLKLLTAAPQQTGNAFSTDSEDEPLAQKLIANVATITQRAPRLLLTAVGVKTCTTTQLVNMGNLNFQSSGGDHIGLSSSDNELPNVRAAVERVVGECDDDDQLLSSHFHKTKTKHLPQYQSTLLQDFMEKTQMLGQTTTTKSTEHLEIKPSHTQNELLVQINTNSQSDSIASSAASASVNKKRRGRPKKADKLEELTLNTMSPLHMNNKVSNINESADSGVISTTSISTQSTSPHPCTTLAASLACNDNASLHSPSKNINQTSPEKLSSNEPPLSLKPKIDIAMLDKRMYATERVLYPPPRNKRRQSMSAVGDRRSVAQQNSSKDDMQLDPVWRKIDVNRKFRRPSVCSTTGYKSDGGGGTSDDRARDRSNKPTVCSKVLAAKSGYVSDYGSSTFRVSKHTKHSNNSGYKSDASCKSRYSTKSCASRKSRAKSCGYRSDCKESVLGLGSKSSKFRRKRRASIIQKSMGSLKDEQDILQLAGLSLGQSSEESNEYVCKPSLEKLPTTSASKKYGEINRYIATGEYFGRGSSGGHHVSHKTFASISNSNQSKIFDIPATELPQTPGKLSLHHPRKNSTTSEFAQDLLQLPGSHHGTARKIKSRRSSVASYCSSFYSVGTTKLRRRRKKKLFRFHNPSSSKNTIVDSKLLTEIEILTNTFSSRCRIHNAGINEKLAGGNLSQKEKLMAEATKLQQSLAAAAQASTSASTSSSKRDSRDKKSLKKRKMSENLDFAMLSARAEGNNMTPSTAGQGTSSKRRHKKASSSSPDDHKLPLKKRHYLLTPGEKSSEVAVAVAAKLFANNAEAWAAAAAAAKTTASTKSQQQFHAKAAKANLTPKKRHLLQQHPHSLSDDSNSNKTPSTLSPLRVAVGDTNSISGGKLLDISPQSLNSLKQVTEAVNKKRSRLEGLVSRIATTHNEELTICPRNKSHLASALQIESESSSCPPPGIFEPSVELEIQIPPISKLSESNAAVITKSEVDSPLLMDINKSYVDPPAQQKTNGQKMVESLLNKTGGNLILKRKRKKINRTGFPTVKRKKRKIQENNLMDETPDDVDEVIQEPGQIKVDTPHTELENIQVAKQCDRVPQVGETSQTFLERNNRTPRLSVVALERLQESPLSSKEALDKLATTDKPAAEPATPKSRHARREIKRKADKEYKNPATDVADDLATKDVNKQVLAKVSKKSDKSKSSEIDKEYKIPAAEVAETNDDVAAKDVNKQTLTKASKKSDKSKSSETEPDKPVTTKVTKKLLSSRIDNLAEDEDDKPLASRARRSKNGKETNEVILKVPTTIRKTTMSKAVKSLLDANIKLPAGIDPSSLLSCKIKLKRRNSIHPLALTPNCPPPAAAVITENVRTREEIEMDAKSKDCNINYETHEVLPQQDSRQPHINGDAEQSDTSEEKSSNNSTLSFSARKLKVNKKSYLPAGLFSDYFKINHLSNKKNSLKKDLEKRLESGDLVSDVIRDNDLARLRLPPPPYCERYLRRTEMDFELPYDIWWAYKNSKLPSRITVASWNFRKIRTNMYAENVKPPPIVANDLPMCNCKPDIGCGDNCLNRMVYTECSPSNCPSREKCRNQKIQRHEIAPGVERFMTENKGWGVRSKLKITRGTYILEYVGEVVTEREFKDRMATIYLNDTHHYCLHLDGGLVIDGHRMGSDCRFVNHSCEPNCEIQKWSVNGLSRMALFAKRHIEEGEELTYDYNFSLFNPSEGQPCRCNTPNCRGVIGGKSQRVKPLQPIELKPIHETTTQKEDQKSRQRKRKAKKNTQRPTTKDVTTPTRMQSLSEKEVKLIKQYSIFLMRNFEKIRAKKIKLNVNESSTESTKPQSPTVSGTPVSSSSSNPSSVAAMPAAVIQQRRPSTPASLAAQITALCTARNIKTRGLTMAVQDPELEKMAKMAKILRDICANLEAVKCPDNEQHSLVSTIFMPPTTVGANKKKKASLKSQQKSVSIDFKIIQSNIEQGYYKLPQEFNSDMLKLLKEAKQLVERNEPSKLSLVKMLETLYEEEKLKQYSALLDILGSNDALKDFADLTNTKLLKTNVNGSEQIDSPFESLASTNEDIIRCICGLYKDEGLMIQCARCMVWQHTECTKADVIADNYHCEKCEPRGVDKEIPLDDYTEECHRYYLTLMRGSDLQVRQGDAVYVLRDIPVKDAAGNVVPSQKHTYKTIGEIDYNECDIFRVERLWKDDQGKRFIFGHHFLRPHETFHEPSRRFYPNEVVRVPLYEVVPINLVIGRCWVLDRTTFCKGRPIECNDERHCFICELRVDKSARFFSKAKTNHPTCTKSYAFRKFNEKLRISKTYAPHDVNPAMLKTKKQKTENECQNLVASSPIPTTNTAAASSSAIATKHETVKTPQTPSTKKRQNSKSPATVISMPPAERHLVPVMTVKQKRLHLENVLKHIKNRYRPLKTVTTINDLPVDLTYLLTGRGARQRKTPIKKDFV